MKKDDEFSGFEFAACAVACIALIAVGAFFGYTFSRLDSENYTRTPRLVDQLCQELTHDGNSTYGGGKCYWSWHCEEYSPDLQICYTLMKSNLTTLMNNGGAE